MNSLKMVQVTIDGQHRSVPESYTLLQAIEDAGKSTPTICYHEATTPEGLCRQCVVEVEGARLLPPACVTQVREGMTILTRSERVDRARRTLLEMLNASTDLSEAPEILAQMEEYAADPDRFPGAERRSRQVLDDNPFYVRDYVKCVLCWRCVQACGDDLQFTYALSLGGRGHESNIATFFDAPMPETTCVFCGNCVAVCPTNALKHKTEYFLEKGLDFDQIRVEKKQAMRKQRSKEQKHD